MKYSPTTLLLQIATCVVVQCGHASAAIRTVTNLDDSGAGSLRATIAAASSGDTIRFALTGTIVLTSGTLVISKNLTIEGPGDPGSLTITRPNVSEPRYRIFHVDRSSVTLTGLTISRGIAPDGGGGGIRNTYGSLTVQNCVLANNQALPHATGPDGGGAIHNVALRGENFDGHATLMVSSCAFVDNSSDAEGGAISSSQFVVEVGNGAGVTTTNVQGCTFTGNSAVRSGGAIADSGGGSLTVSDSRFLDNSSNEMGGGLSARHGLILEASSFEGNEARVGGGGVAGEGVSTLRGCLLHQNVGGEGGAIENLGTMDLERCTLSLNRAPSGGRGGGIIQSSSSRTLTLSSCTMSGNRALSGGQSIHKKLAGSSVVLRNTILEGTGPHLEGMGSFTSGGFNICEDDDGGFLRAEGDQINTDARLDPAGPQDHGGPTKTIALLSASQALDRGKAFGLTTDQRGVQRPIELSAYPNAIGSDGSDIGAFESVEPLAFPIVVTTLHDHDDGVAGETDCTLREAIARVNALGAANIFPGPGEVTFRSGLQGTLALDRNLGPLTVTGSLTLTGPGARLLAVSAGGYMRVFHFSGSGSGSLIGLTIRDGSTVGDLGNPATPGLGGGIYNQGVLTCRDCTFESHTARGGTATTLGGHGSDGYGGGIYNSGYLTLERCTFTGCQAFGAFGMDDPTPGGVGIPPGRGGNGGNGRGGAIYHAGTSLAITQCTFQGNNASGSSGGNGFRFGGGGGIGQGGAIFCGAAGMRLTGSTVAGNFSLGGSGGLGSNSAFDGPAGFGSGAVTVLNTGGADFLRGTVIAGNLRNGNFPADVGGAFNSEGFNLIGSAGTATGLTHGTDQKGTNEAPLNAQLGVLRNNGGQTNSMAPLAGSPLVDKGHSFGSSSDQRGLPRPLDAPGIPDAAGGDASDIGSVETDAPQTGPVFVVNSLADHDDGSPSYLDCTLREALNAANFTAGADTVLFRPGLTGNIVLDPALGSLTIYDPVTLIGPGARELTLLRATGEVGRILLVQGGPHFVSGLTLRGGNLIGNTGGQWVQGGGILTQGVLTVSDCTITRNTATAGNNDVFPGQPGGSAIGGGVANIGGGNLTLHRCTISLNSTYGGRGWQDASSSEPGGDASGGAVFNDTGSTLTVVNCTFSDNSATGGNSGHHSSFAGDQGGAAQGGICNRGSMSLTASTLRGCNGSGGASGFTIPRGAGVGGLFAAPGSTSLVRNTLCAANFGNFVASDIAGAFSSGGYNLIGNADTGSGFTAATDQRGTASSPLDARFGAFFNYGGPTDTVGLQTNSPALDRGHSFGLTTDQRGAARRYDDPSLVNAAGGDGTDIGAFETVPAYNGPPEIISFARQGTAFHILVQGKAGRNYRLQTSAALDIWINAGSPAPADGLGLVEFIDPTPSEPRNFYQALELP